MTHQEAARLAELQARVEASDRAVVSAREDLIERLGDHLCGGPDGAPTRADLKVLARARRDATRNRRLLAQFLTASTLGVVARTSSAAVFRSAS